MTWEKNGAESKWNVRYRKVAYFEDFENGLDDWSVYTLGDSPQTNGWYAFNVYNANDQFEAHSGSLFASAWSWYNNTVYNANNWLITPKIDLQGTLKFWVYTFKNDPDKYEVLLSTTGKETTDFTTTLQPMAAGPTTGEWTEVSIDLSAYAGQQGYIAFHHVSNDDNYLFIDDVELCVSDWQTLETPVDDTQCTLTGLTKGTGYEVQVQAVYDDETTGDWAESYVLQTIGVIPLLEDDSESDSENGEIIDEIVKLNEPVDIVLYGRTLDTNGYNTFAVPFDLSSEQITAALGEGTVVKKLVSSSLNSGVLTLNFENATSIEAGKPYLVKVAANVENPVFENVTVSSTVTATTTTHADLVPTFGKTLVTGPTGNADDTQSVLFLGAANKLIHPSVVNAADNAASYIKGFRAYFQLKNGAAARSVYMNLGGGESTSVETVGTGSAANSAVYTLDGRKVSDEGQLKSLPKGVYIMNGKKFIK